MHVVHVVERLLAMAKGTDGEVVGYRNGLCVLLAGLELRDDGELVLERGLDRYKVWYVRNGKEERERWIYKINEVCYGMTVMASISIPVQEGPITPPAADRPPTHLATDDALVRWVRQAG